MDIAFDYLGKGIRRTIGGLARDFFSGGPRLWRERILVLQELKKDPFDVWDELSETHYQYRVQPILFFLMAKKNSRYDKNILPADQHQHALLKKLTNQYKIGIHPSWQTGDHEGIMESEKRSLEKYYEEALLLSRQHYIRFHLPDTFQNLIASGITDDYSMGYGSINGFRASTCRPYYWFNLANNSTTKLLLHPFSYMEANSIFEQKDSPENAFEEIKSLMDFTYKTGGEFVPIFHNNFIGKSKKGRLWMDIYKKMLQHFSQLGS